jgi:hypothetical protein
LFQQKKFVFLHLKTIRKTNIKPCLSYCISSPNTQYFQGHRFAIGN